MKNLKCWLLWRTWNATNTWAENIGIKLKSDKYLKIGAAGSCLVWVKGFKAYFVIY